MLVVHLAENQVGIEPSIADTIPFRMVNKHLNGDRFLPKLPFYSKIKCPYQCTFLEEVSRKNLLW